MAFRQIGIPARKVIDRIESERAAVKVAQGIAANRSGEESEGSPTLIADAPARSGSGIGKGPRREAPASQQGGQTPSTMPGSKVIAPPTSRFPRRSAIIFDLDMERRARHQARSLSRAGALDLRPLAR